MASINPLFSTRTFSSGTKQVLISPNKRINLIFGANTDVGKTLVSAGLARASLTRGTTYYVKPLQCGGSDQTFLERHCSSLVNKLNAQTLFRWETPASPHRASIVENVPVSDAQVLEKLRATLSGITNKEEMSTTLIETAGGVLSPSSASPANVRPQHAASKGSDGSSWGWITQADLYQPLLGYAPVILVGDGRLGGISATITGLESLVVRGYDVVAVVMIATEHDNLSAVQDYVSRKVALRSGSGEALFMTPKQAIVGLPPIPRDPLEPLDDWYQSDQVDNTFAQLDYFLQNCWEGQVSDMKEMRAAGAKVVWWPFTQHGNIDGIEKVTHIDSANGDDFILLHDTDNGTLESKHAFDACASWWTQGLGHGDSSMALASAAAAGRYGHVIFPEVVHAPAVALSQKLVGPSGPGSGWASRVFYSDDGSTAMEVAIKMGLKLYKTRMGVFNDDDDDVTIDWVVCAQEGCYHGDTLGVMDVAEPSIFNEGQHPWYEPKGLFLDTPTLGYQDGTFKISFPESLMHLDHDTYEFDSMKQSLDVQARMLTSLFSHYREMIEMQWLVYEHSGVNRKIACVVMEPVLIAAGGMKFVDPLWQRALMETARSRNVPIVFDEVASGLYRLGVQSCREILKSDPDIACYAKLLTGGVVPLSVTLASEEVFDAYLGEGKEQAFLHGHSYTAHPVGCVSALQALSAYERVLENRDEATAPREFFDQERTKSLSTLPGVEKCFSLGTVLALTIKPLDGSSGYAATSSTLPIIQALRRRGVFARPLGNVVYIMVTPLTSKDECDHLMSILYKAIEELGVVNPRGIVL